MNDLVTNVTSMTLKEITDMLDVRHNNAMRTVAEMAEDPAFGTATQIEYQLPAGNGATQTIHTYQLDKRQSIAVAARLNVALLMRIIDRWQELEGQVKPNAESLASDMITRGILPGMVGWWREQVNGGYHGENNWNITPKSSVSELMYSFHNYCQRNGLYRIPGWHGFGHSYTDAQFKISLKEVSGIWSVRELKHHTTDDLKVRLESRLNSINDYCLALTQ